MARFSSRALLLVPLVAACGGSTSTQAPSDIDANLPDTSRIHDERRRGLRDRAELEAFLDRLMTADLKHKYVAGAVVAVVKDGTLFFAKGYGYADVERRKPVDPERTLFRIGSVTKLFTWTAAMQLVEAGRLDLDADVNRYLDFQIPATYAEPITLKHLMTHTAGFEDDARDLWARHPAQIMPVGRWLATHMPERVRPPGAYIAYSNHGTALAGYIVERVSGMSWEDYVEQRILNPLDMTRTTGRQPLPARFREEMSQGYRSSRGAFDPKDWELLMGASPAGAMSASATDMATFMLAHLGNGAVGDRRILSEATAVRMHARVFGHDPRIPGFALGFYEKSSHGLRIIGHSGNTRWFHTDLALIPSESVGVFVSYNGEERGTELIAFMVDGPGRATHGFVASIPLMALERVSWYQLARLHWVILGAGVVIFAAIARAALDRLIRRRGDRPRTGDALPGRSLIVWVALVNLTFVVIFVLLMADPIAMMTLPVTALMIALAFPMVGAALTVLAAAAAVRHWKNGLGTRAARIRYDAVIVVALLFTWSLSQWNLLWWRL